ncbi:carbonic anhydrase [Flavobacterium gelatinilyticum]|uniref:carbonic anhydrase n=1 Tax=Flavobacterium gelatinilyticum TaxID=3003260 RepID=UPI003D78E78F
MEFACKVSDAKLVLIMGHQHCRAIKGPIDDVKLDKYYRHAFKNKTCRSNEPGF